LSAYIPGRRQRTGRDEYLSRPRFLAISEFGPRAVVYHEGSRYIIHKVILTFEEGEEEIATQRAKQCGNCGYLHPIVNGDGPDLCERCHSPLGAPLASLFRLRNVSTRRRERISSDEEERVRMGFELQTGVRFAEPGGQPSCRVASAELDGHTIATLTYGQSATLWRINLGWRRRKDPNRFGFVLDTERGYWAKSDLEAENEPDDPLSSRTRRVIPYVEDRRNCLIFEPSEAHEPELMASLQAALKTAIQARYQLEDNELAAEPLPSADVRRSILFYEAAEGGAGVLRRLLDDVDALGEISWLALDLCHFDPATGTDLHRAPTAKEDCEAACYDCLMSYTNQRDHQYLDRHLVKDFLLDLAASEVRAAASPIPRAEHYQRLVNLCGSDLERKWLALLEEKNLRLPSDAQVLIEACGTRPDFLYRDHLTAIYIDGPHHLYTERAARDQAQTEAMEDLGYTVVRFTAEEDWTTKIGQFPGLFGSLA
jgi:very-short-patch-repair endonuclease